MNETETNVQTDIPIEEPVDTGTTEIIGETIEETLSEFKPQFIGDFFTSPYFPKTVNALIAVAVFYLLYRITGKILNRIPTPKLTPQAVAAVRKGIKYLFFALAFLYILGIFGIRLNGLLGAAGIAGIAIGFAAQTSFSNIISGFFLLTEKTLKIGDYITIDDVTGTVDSIDLLSVKIHTTDNQMIRIPNETIIKSNLKNTTYFPIRRLSVSVSVSYDTSLEKAAAVLLSVPSRCPDVLQDPAPAVFWEEFGDSGIGVRLAVWLKTDKYWDVRNAVFTEIKKAFDENGIDIPFPQVDLHTKAPSLPDGGR